MQQQSSFFKFPVYGLPTDSIPTEEQFAIISEQVELQLLSVSSGFLNSPAKSAVPTKNIGIKTNKIFSTLLFTDTKL